VAFIRELVTERGATVFLCTHDLALADTICDAYGFIDAGAMRAWGTRAELQAEAGLADSLRVDTLEGELVFPLGREPDSNALLKSLMDSGRRIVEARRERPSLEDLYFSFIKEARHVIA
jgi:ABC-2 type transport system ATP-binding protein